MKVLLISLLFAVLNVSCNPDSTSEEESDKSEKVVFYQVKVLSSGEFYFFVIEKEGKVIINQNTIPAVQGHQEFRSSDDAKKVGELMKNKLENNLFPPTIEISELDSLGINYD